MILTSTEKDRARGKLRDAVKHGKIIKPSNCQQCNEATVRRFLHGHHHKGYDKPLDVIWLCLSCHNEIDASTRSLRGERTSRAVLTDKQAENIRHESFMFGTPGKDLAKSYKVSEATISFILNRKSYWLLVILLFSLGSEMKASTLQDILDGGVEGHATVVNTGSLGANELEDHSEPSRVARIPLNHARSPLNVSPVDRGENIGKPRSEYQASPIQTPSINTPVASRHEVNDLVSLKQGAENIQAGEGRLSAGSTPSIVEAFYSHNQRMLQDWKVGYDNSLFIDPNQAGFISPYFSLLRARNLIVP